jgi:hypothetical protein
MRLSRPSKTFAALFVPISILFMQFAVAAYACPGSQGGPAAEQASPTATPAITNIWLAATIDPSRRRRCVMRIANPTASHWIAPVHPDISPFVAGQLVISSLIPPLHTGLLH